MRVDPARGAWLLPIVGGIAAAGVLLAGCSRRGPAPESAPEPETPSPNPSPSPGAVPAEQPSATKRIRIAQLNAQNLFDPVDTPRVQDDVPSEEVYRRKLGKLSLAIRDVMRGPDIIALQEVENERVLRDLAARPEIAALGYLPLIAEGSDPRGIDVAYLYRPDRVELVHHEQRRATYRSPAGRNVQLFTRPPLVATFRPAGSEGAGGARDGAALTLVNNHFTSKLQGDSGTNKRQLQSAFVASIADGTAGVAHLDPSRVIVVGDLNETIGEPAYEALVGGRTEGAPALVNAADRLPAADRYSWRDGTRRSLLDHVLLAPALDARVAAVSIPHINSDASPRMALDPLTPQRSSDHDPVIVDLVA